MKRHILAFVFGGVFAEGLLVSGMTRPPVVIGFLDFFGDWDPSLLIVLGTGMAVYIPAAWLARTRLARQAPGAEKYVFPEPERFSVRFYAGSILFGLGWGAVGLCPGPALVGFCSGSADGILFFGAMVASMVVTDLTLKAREK